MTGPGPGRRDADGLGPSVLSGVAARRFASQLNENAKYPAIAGVL
ncbi:MAG: SIS domain-containing protein, partial [Streptosporangiales bacterium]